MGVLCGETYQGSGVTAPSIPFSTPSVWMDLYKCSGLFPTVLTFAPIRNAIK